MSLPVQSIDEYFSQIVKQFEGLTPEQILKGIAEIFGKSVPFACSFGAEDMVILDMIARYAPLIPIFMLDTGRLPEETYEVVDRCRAKYDLKIDIYTPQSEALQRLLIDKGPFSFQQSIANRKECCGIRKIEPLQRALNGKRGWITGLRREQSVTRTELAIVELDAIHGNILKFNPLKNYTEEQVWDYIHAHRVPYHKLHDLGYPSIGCAPCTRAIQPGEGVRAGRWWWESPDQKECGLHGGSMQRADLRSFGEPTLNQLETNLELQKR